MEEFLCGEDKVRLVAYGSILTFYKELLPGTSHYNKCKPAREVISKAQFYCENPKEWTREWGKYDLYSNNCEHFASYCKTGIHCSKQAGDGHDTCGKYEIPSDPFTDLKIRVNYSRRAAVQIASKGVNTSLGFLQKEYIIYMSSW